ncbi:MAG: arginine decarboxylase [Kordia sp.]|nr:MAG: arginine decarboxylase [Kordia sp.]
MKLNKIRTNFLLAMILVFVMSSCVVVKEYEKVYVNDADMKLTANKINKFETNFQVYREAASGANGGKAGGGCGCN